MKLTVLILLQQMNFQNDIKLIIAIERNSDMTANEATLFIMLSLYRSCELAKLGRPLGTQNQIHASYEDPP